jgi:AraC-like DNA-binding protein
MTNATERAIMHMWERYTEPLPLSEMASTAILSRFHFSRVFRDETGVSPGRFLSAIRLYEAKRLLLTTSLSVTDISYGVGYNSLGTFTRRFTQSVGISPTRFRRMSELGLPAIPHQVTRAHEDSGKGSVIGTVQMPDHDVETEVYLGLFDGPIAQGMPPCCAVLRDDENVYLLSAVPPGLWYAHAVAMEVGVSGPERWTRKPLSVGVTGPFKVHANATVEVDILMRPKQLTDMPILLALPVLDAQRELREAPPVAARRAPVSRSLPAICSCG